MNREDLAARLLAIFLSELEEQTGGMNRDLLALEAAPDDAEALRSLFRAAHTLKGAAHAAGVPAVEGLCHSLESLLADVREGKQRLGSSEFAYLFSSVDLLADAGRRLLAGEQLPGDLLPQQARRPGASVQKAAHAAAPRPEGVPPAAPAAVRRSDPAPPAAPSLPVGVRVEADQLNALVALTGELRTAAERVAAHAQRLDQVSERARRARNTAQAGATLADEHTDALATLAIAGRQEARSLEQITSRLGRQASRLRLRPFSDAAESLPRIVRDLAQAAGKEVRFTTRGLEVEADREVWVTAREALLHLLRNAVDHGLEPPSAREAAGKPREGGLALTAEAAAERIVITLADDGRGLDLKAIRAQLREEGLPVPDDEGELVRTVFRSGFSTLSRATLTSGRGVGLDSVRAAIERIGGSVTLTSAEGSGTVVTLSLPASLTGARALLVRVGAQVFAIPALGVERVRRLRREDEVHTMDGQEVYQTRQGPVPLRAMGPLFGLSAPEGENGYLFMVAVRDGERRLGLVVDECVDEQELLVRPLQHVQGRVHSLSGAAILSDGRIAPVLNVAAAIDQAMRAPAAAALRGEAAAGQARRRPRVLVVDDSITTRVLEQSILEAAGYEVLAAPDGAEGLSLLQQQRFDLVVSDVEMPRMDGIDLCRAIRASSGLREIPVVLVTARESAEDRARGLEAGADAYLPKSSFDQEQLLSAIHDLLGETA